MIASYLENEVRLESWIELKGLEGFRRVFSGSFWLFRVEKWNFQKRSKFIK